MNLRPSGYEPDELPDCSTPHQIFSNSMKMRRLFQQKNTRLSFQGTRIIRRTETQGQALRGLGSNFLKNPRSRCRSVCVLLDDMPGCCRPAKRQFTRHGQIDQSSWGRRSGFWSLRQQLIDAEPGHSGPPNLVPKAGLDPARAKLTTPSR